MSDYISAELTATCAALGYYDGQKYHLDKHCFDVIRDLIKYLKRDDDNHTVRRFLGHTKVLQTDLIRILIDHSEKLELWDVLLRLIINLTSPALIIYNEVIPTEKTARTIYQQIVSHLQAYKVALSDDRIWTAVSSRLGKILKTDDSERGEENEMIIERILALIRNVLQVPPDDKEKRVDNDITIHDEVLFAFHASGMVDLLLFIASNDSEQQYHLQVLEIMSLMLREQNASQLAASGLQRSTAEKERDEATLLAVRQKEVQEKMEKMKKYAGSRHSRFGGTYVVQNMKAIGENQLLCHKPYQTIEALNFSQDKKKVRRPKNKRPMEDPREERTSALSVRLFLKEFCVEFLNAAYNPVMRYARSCVISGSQSESSEATFYLWALRFFMEFNRHYKFEVKYVSETISTEVFYLVQRQMTNYYEMMITDKKRIPLWSRRLHLALKAYQELLHTLMAMDKSTDRGVRESSRVIKSNVFYVPEYRETILSQLLCFDEVKMSRLYLADLVTTAHIFLKMLEQFCGKGKRSLIVQTLKRKRQKAKRQKKATQVEKVPSRSLEERWDDIGPELSAVMREGQIPDVVPFDATLDIPIDDQKSDAMKRIQKLLRSKYLEQAIGLIRAAREVWPENDCFGKADMPPEEEFLALREIFFADLGVIEEETTEQREENEEFENSLNHLPEYDEEEEEENEGVGPIVEEANFNFNEFLNRFANVKIVKAAAILVSQFDKNSIELNHYVVKMLHRIAWECKMPGMIFQASIFRAFQRILESKHPEHKELQKFAVFIIRRFTEVAQRNRKAYMELLFWKTTRDATEVVEGYSAERDNKKVSRSVWTETEEDELRTLFMEHQTNKYPRDVVDWILEHLINRDRTRRAVIKKLKELFLIVNSKAVRSDIQKRLPKDWAEEEIAELTELWEESKDGEDPVDAIFAGLRIKRPKPKIKEKLLELGLAKDRKELRKKRSRKSDHGKSSWETQSVSNSDEDEGSDEGTGKSSRRNSVAPSKPTNKRTKKSTRKQPTMVYTDAQLSGLVKDVIDKNMREALEWIKESLQDALDDRDEESSEGIPLVPLTDYSSAAMDSPSFQKLLRALGLLPPADEQESYWRIPANVLNSTLQKRGKLIEDALEGNFIVEGPQRESRGGGSDVDDKNSDSDESIDVLENIKKFFGSKEPGPEPSTSRQSDSEASAKSEGKRRKSTKFPKSRKHSIDLKIVEEEEQEEEEEEEAPAAAADGLQSVEEAKVEKKKVGGRAKQIFDSSESEMEVEPDPIVNQDDGKRSRSDSSDKENTTVKKRRLLDSDEEEEPSMTQDYSSKATRLIISDDEEESSTTHENNVKSSRLVISDDDETSEQNQHRNGRRSSRAIISDDED